MLKKEASLIVGGWSKPSKMPCKSYSLPAEACKTGSTLRQIIGTVCSECYACKGMYRFPVVQRALWKRLASLVDPKWAEAMITIIGDDEYFRWHDSGDLQGQNHLLKIYEICYATPNTKHWLPTKEASLVKHTIKAYGIPENLVIRISATMVDGRIGKADGNLVSSRAVTHDDGTSAWLCPAPKNDNKCGTCRACWNPDVVNVDYLLH